MPLGIAPSQCPERPTRCSRTARFRGEPMWQTTSTWPMSMPSSSEAVATTTGYCAGFEFFFDLEASFARQTAVMRADFALAQTLGQLVRHAFDQTARVDEDQRRVVRLNLRHELIVDRGPDILADNRSELFIGHLDVQAPSRACDRHRQWRSRARRPPQYGASRPADGQFLRSAFASRSSRFAAAAARPAHPDARAIAPDARRVCLARSRGFHRRSMSRAVFKKSRLRAAVSKI